MNECPNGCDLEEFGGTHQGPPDCDLKPCNPDHRGRKPAVDRELLKTASDLLATGTCNSLIAANRQQWNIERDRVVLRLRELATG